MTQDVPNVQLNVWERLGKTSRHADVVQALFDLASSHCTKVPDCASCPMRSVCPAGAKFLSKRVNTLQRLTPVVHERIHRDKKYPDRIFRGRILKAVRETRAGISLRELGPLIDPTFEPILDTQWLNDMLWRLARDGFVIIKRTRVFLS